MREKKENIDDDPTDTQTRKIRKAHSHFRQTRKTLAGCESKTFNDDRMSETIEKQIDNGFSWEMNCNEQMWHRDNGLCEL
jgi:hypothetical protein